MVKVALEKLASLDFAGAKAALGESISHTSAVISDAASPYVEPVLPYLEPVKPYALMAYEYWEDLSVSEPVFVEGVDLMCD